MARLKIKSSKKNRNDKKSMSCPLLCALRPLGVEDMAAGYEYAPGMSILHVQTPPLFGEQKNEALVYLVPLWMPPQYRASTEFNIFFALELIRRLDPEADACIEQLKAIVRAPHTYAHTEAYQRINSLPPPAPHVAAFPARPHKVN